MLSGSAIPALVMLKAIPGSFLPGSLGPGLIRYPVAGGVDRRRFGCGDDELHTAPDQALASAELQRGSPALTATPARLETISGTSVGRHGSGPTAKLVSPGVVAAGACPPERAIAA